MLDIAFAATAAAIPPDIRPHRRTGHSTAHRSDISAAPTADLVPDHPTDDPADDATAHAQPAATRLIDALAFHPTPTLGFSVHRARRGDGDFRDAFVRTTTPLVVRDRLRR